MENGATSALQDYFDTAYWDIFKQATTYSQQTNIFQGYYSLTSPNALMC